MLSATVLVAQAAERQDGPFLWIAAGIVLGIVVGFVYAAARHVARRRRPERGQTGPRP